MNANATAMRLIQIWKVARCGCFGPLSVPMTGVASSNRNVRQCRRGIPATRQTDRPERHRQRSTALIQSISPAAQHRAAARVGDGVLGALWVHIPEKLENSTGRENRPSKRSKISGSPERRCLQRAAEGVGRRCKVSATVRGESRRPETLGNGRRTLGGAPERSRD